MALIIENGSIVQGANSYVTVQEIIDYAELRGIEYSNNLEAQAILAMDFLQSKCYQGVMVDPSTQPLLWPRKGVYIREQSVAIDEIPQQLKDAQIELALAAGKEQLLTDGTQSGSNIKREKVDSLETEYYEGGKSSEFNSQRVNSYLRMLLRPIGALRV